jgi:hypothetical protein
LDEGRMRGESKVGERISSQKVMGVQLNQTVQGDDAAGLNESVCCRGLTEKMGTSVDRGLWLVQTGPASRKARRRCTIFNRPVMGVTATLNFEGPVHRLKESLPGLKS